MDTKVRVRGWLGARDSYLGGYVRTKTLEVVLSATAAVTYHITRQFGVLIFPTTYLRFCALFAYVPALFLPWRYTLVIPAIIAFTSEEPFGSTLGVAAGIQVAYFFSRWFKKYRSLALILATFTANVFGIWVRSIVVGPFTFEQALGPSLIKAVVLAVIMLILAPLIYKTLEYLGIINFKR